MKRGRKITGGKYHKQKKKKLHEFQPQERKVTLGVLKSKSLKIRSGISKTVLLNSNIANILSPDSKKMSQATIKNVLETPQNRFLARQNRLMKGAIIETEQGKAQITNRPSQEGLINAVLIKTESN
jgi:small subunit ribosomal protein S8e